MGLGLQTSPREAQHGPEVHADEGDADEGAEHGHDDDGDGETGTTHGWLSGLGCLWFGPLTPGLPLSPPGTLPAARCDGNGDTSPARLPFNGAGGSTCWPTCSTPSQACCGSGGPTPTARPWNRRPAPARSAAPS